MGELEIMSNDITKAQQNKAGRLFDTIADIGALFMAVLYIFYVSLLLIFDLGTSWLNYSMLSITIAYIVFFIFKILVLNKVVMRKKAKKIARLTLRYTKWGMKIINAVFVALTLASVQLSGNHIVSMIGVFVVGFSFLVSVMWDVMWWIAKRKLRELKNGWDDLSQKEKNRRVELLVSSIMRSVDNITGLDLTHSVARIAKHAPELADAQDNAEDNKTIESNSQN